MLFPTLRCTIYYYFIFGGKQLHCVRFESCYVIRDDVIICDAKFKKNLESLIGYLSISELQKVERAITTKKKCHFDKTP